MINVIFVGVLVCCAPFLIKKQRRSKLGILYSRGLFAFYLAWVFMITILLRHHKVENMVNVSFLASYYKMLLPIVEGYRNGGIIVAIERLSWIGANASSIVLNIFLFVPMGYLIPLSFEGAKKFCIVFTLGVGTSLFIETVQLISQCGWFDVDDIFHNAIGTIWGWLLYRHCFVIHPE